MRAAQDRCSDEVADKLRYAISQRLRKRIEECFAWSKTVGGLAQVKVRGLDKVRAVVVFGIAAYKLVRLRKLWLPRAKCVLRREKEEEMVPFHPQLTAIARAPAKNLTQDLLLANTQ